MIDHRIEADEQFGGDTRPPLPVEVIERGKREKEFYESYYNPSQIPDKILLVPKNFENLDLPLEIARLAPSLAHSTVCDYGCGCGLTSAFFALRGARTFAFDVSEKNASLAKRTARVNGVADRVFVQAAQGEATGYPENSFDLLFGKGVLHHLELAIAAQEMYRILKPGGAAAFYEPLGENKLLEWIRNCPLRSPKHRHTADERNILYSDLAILKANFDSVSYRETGLLSIVKTLCRKVEIGMVAVPRGGPVLDALAACDRWIFGHMPSVRRFAQHIVVLMLKDGDSSSIGGLLRTIARDLQHSGVDGVLSDRRDRSMSAAPAGKG